LLLVILRQWLIIAVLKLGSLLYDRASPCLKACRILLLGQQLKPYKPQKQYLSLIGTGDPAIASWGSLGLALRSYCGTGKIGLIADLWSDSVTYQKC